MKFILGEKIEMRQVWGENGEVQPITVVKAGPCQITAIKTQDKDGYSAVQIGFGQSKKQNKPQKGHLKDLPPFRYLREFRVKDASGMERGASIDVSVFAPGDKVKVTGISKGRGFQGVVKRHGFSGQPSTHGHKDQERMPGSIGAGGVQHVRKGKRMAGRMGCERVTIKNLGVVAVHKENNLLMIKGAVPGARHSFLMISAN